MDSEKLDLFWIGLEQNLGENKPKTTILFIVIAYTKTGNPGKLETRDGFFFSGVFQQINGHLGHLGP